MIQQTFRLLLLFLMLTLVSAFKTQVASAQIACGSTTKITTCGQTTYDTCSQACNGTTAIYNCVASQNTNCQGTITCSSENSRCGGGGETTPTPVACTNDCNSLGTAQCSGGGIRTCGNYDSDSCLEWSSVNSCPSGSTCSGGICSGPAGSCTEAGYASCYTYSSTFGSATSTTRLAVSSSYDKDLVTNCGLDASCVKDNFTIFYKCTGDKLTYVINNTGTCNSSGCSGTSGSLEGTVNIKSAAAKGYPLVNFYCWDRTDRSGWWAWSYTNAYYDAYSDIYILKCFNNLQCGTGSYCDKSLDWSTWQCRTGTAPTPVPTSTPTPSPTSAPQPQQSTPADGVPAAGVTKHDLNGNQTQANIPFNDSTDSVYHISGNLTLGGNNTGTKSGVVFVDGDLNINADYYYGAAGPTSAVAPQVGTVFVVGGNVYIAQSVTRVDAVIISSGKIYTAATSGTTCSSTNLVQTSSPLTINGSLISLNQIDQIPINFCRTLSDNSIAAEKIVAQPKYLVILRHVLSDTLQRWSEIDASTPIPTSPPSQPTATPTSTPTQTPTPSPTPAPTTYTLASGYSGTQGTNNWHYYWVPETGGSPSQATYTTSNMLMKEWFGQPDNVYWTRPNSWMAVDPTLNTGGDNEVAIIYWRAPGRGIAQVTVTERRIETSGKGNGFTFGVKYTPSIGAWPSASLGTMNVPSSDMATKTITVSQQMQGNGDAVAYFKGSNFSTYGDTSTYTISITFTPN